MKITTSCCSAKTPVGVTNPTFTWSISDADAKVQTAYRLKIYNREYDWDSGIIESSENVRVKCDGLELKSNEKYYWNVEIFTDKGIFKSDNSWFITGFVCGEEPNWITAPGHFSAPLLRKEFTLSDVPQYATVNVCGLGLFELYINGKKVSDDIMQPVRSDYDTVTYGNLINEFDYTTRKSVYYLSYEVSSYLVRGNNTVVLWLGNGWYRESARKTIRGDFDYGSNLKAFLRLTAGDLVVETDESWQVMESPIIHNNFFSGEIYDAGKFNEKFFTNGYTGGEYASSINAPEAELISQMCPGERVIKTTKAVCIKENIYDALEVVSGFARIKLKGNKGDKVEIFYAEDFDGEKLNYTSTVGYVPDDINQIQKDVYILGGNAEEIYTPRFVWHTYRYIYIKHSESVKILNVDSLFVCTDMPHRVSFNCSDDSINAIYKMYLNTVLSNMHGCTPMDCPHRERLPYTGDGQLSANAAVYNYDGYETYKKWIRDINDSQDMDSGFVPYTAPYSGGCGGHAWGSAVVTVPWHFYMQYGDKDFLAESIPHVEKWLAYLKAQKDDDGYINRHVEGSWCLGDWVMPSKFPWSDPKPEAIKIHPRLVNTVYYIYCINLYFAMCRELGLEADICYVTEKDKCVEVLKNEYVYDNGVFDEQEADVYLLFADIVTDETAYKVLGNLQKKIENRGYTFNSGMVATELMFKVFDRFDKNDIVYKMLKCTDYPSIGYMLSNGATTLWETWEGTGARSHTAFTSIGAWYLYGLSGIKPHGGYKTFTVKPFITEELSFVDTKLTTEYGDICVKWEKSEGSFKLNVNVPFNTSATLILKDKKIILDSGRHIFDLK